MCGVILIVAYNLVDIHHIKEILKYSKSESSILLTTFFATLFLELEFAIYLGVLLSLIIFLARTSTPEVVTLAPDIDDKTGKKKLVNITKKPLNQCPQLKILRVDMSIYFGSINHIQNRLHHIIEQENIKHILIIGTGINFIDLSGAEALVTDANRLQKQGGGLYFAELKANVYEYISRNCFVAKVGNKYFFDKKSDSIKYIYNILDENVCSKCEARVFNECN